MVVLYVACFLLLPWFWREYQEDPPPSSIRLAPNTFSLGHKREPFLRHLGLMKPMLLKIKRIDAISTALTRRRGDRSRRGRGVESPSVPRKLTELSVARVRWLMWTSPTRRWDLLEISSCSAHNLARYSWLGGQTHLCRYPSQLPVSKSYKLRLCVHHTGKSRPSSQRWRFRVKLD